jgi:hypothetical protein
MIYWKQKRCGVISIAYLPLASKPEAGDKINALLQFIIFVRLINEGTANVSVCCIFVIYLQCCQNATGSVEWQDD